MHESMLNYCIRLTFTDGSNALFVNARENQELPDETVKNLFIRLWDQAGTSVYDKSQ